MSKDTKFREIGDRDKQLAITLVFALQDVLEHCALDEIEQTQYNVYDQLITSARAQLGLDSAV